MLFTNSGHAPMGWGLPAAIGAYFANPKIKTYCFTGDGGLMMNIQELATLMHHQIPMTIFIFNNDGYLTIKQTQQLGFKSRIMGANYNSGLSFPSFKKIANSFKLKYFSIDQIPEVDRVLNKIKKSINLLFVSYLLVLRSFRSLRHKTIEIKMVKLFLQSLKTLFPFLNEIDIKIHFMMIN